MCVNTTLPIRGLSAVKLRTKSSLYHNFRFSAGVFNLSNLKYHYLKRKIRKDVFRYEENIFRIKYYASILLRNRDKSQYEE